MSLTGIKTRMSNNFRISWMVLQAISVLNTLENFQKLSLFYFIQYVDEQTLITKGHITFVNYVQNFVQHPALKVNSICRGNYGGSSMWIPTQ